MTWGPLGLGTYEATRIAQRWWWKGDISGTLLNRSIETLWMPSPLKLLHIDFYWFRLISGILSISKYSQKGPSIQRGGFRRKTAFLRNHSSNKHTLQCYLAHIYGILQSEYQIHSWLPLASSNGHLPSDMPIRPNLGVHAKGLKDKRRTTHPALCTYLHWV